MLFIITHELDSAHLGPFVATGTGDGFNSVKTWRTRSSAYFGIKSICNASTS